MGTVSGGPVVDVLELVGEKRSQACQKIFIHSGVAHESG